MWTRGLAQAACEGWAARSVAARDHQELQLTAVTPPFLPGQPDLASAAQGDTWAALELSFDGRRAELPEASRALSSEVLRRWVARTGAGLPPSPLPLPSPSNPTTKERAVTLLVVVLARGVGICRVDENESKRR